MSKKIKLIYVAGPYRARLPWEIETNIHKAWRLGVEVAKLGALPVIPHANSAHMDGLQSDDFWLEATLELMRRCDAVIVTHDWERSYGARGEVDEAKRLGIQVIYGLEPLEYWLSKEQNA